MKKTKFYGENLVYWYAGMPQGAWKERLKHPLLQSFGDLIYPNLTPIMTIVAIYPLCLPNLL